MSPDGALEASGSDAAGAGRTGAGPWAVLRYLDLILLALALPLFIAADWPMTGYAVAAVAWIAQRAVLAYTDARTARSLAAGDRRDAFKTTAISGFARVWLITIAALLVGLFAERQDGLAAALLLIPLFTVQLVTSAASKRGEGAS